MKNSVRFFTGITLLSQFGISLTAPLLICLFLCSMLTTHTGLGIWIYIPGFFLGLGSSAMTAWKFFQYVMKKNQTSEQATGISFNEHH